MFGASKATLRSFLAGLITGLIFSTIIYMGNTLQSNMGGTVVSSGARVFINHQSLQNNLGDASASVGELGRDNLATQMYSQLSANVPASSQPQQPSSPTTLGQATAESIKSFIPQQETSGIPRVEETRQQAQPEPPAIAQVKPEPAASAPPKSLGQEAAESIKSFLPPAPPAAQPAEKPKEVAKPPAAEASLGSLLANSLPMHPLSTFNPVPPKKPSKATDKDCDKNNPQGWNATFMMQPPMPPVEPCKVIVNLMTTFVDNADPSKKVAQENTLRAYQRLRPYGVRAWLFTENIEWARKAREYGVEVVFRFRKNNANTPCLTYMYEYVARNDGCSESPATRVVFDGYINGDILMGKDLADTMRGVHALWGPHILSKKRPAVLVIGHRFNIPIGTTELKTEAEMVAFGKDAKRFQSNAEDYFLFSRGGVNWKEEMAQFVVGRPAYDNWIVDHATHSKHIDVIDASKTVHAIHETCKDGVFAGHAPKLDSGYNKAAINPATKKRVGGHEWDHGTMDHAHFYSEYDKDGKVVFKARPKGRPPNGPKELPPALIRR